jgi:hypothetical protein
MGFAMKKNTLLIAVVVLILAAFMTGCDERSPVAPSMEPVNVLKIVRITTSADSIYLDAGRTFADISVYIENQNNDPVVGETVYFQKNLGKLLAIASTDSYGIASAVFSDDGVSGDAIITAYVMSPTIGDPETKVIVDEASINVRILPVPDVSNISISLLDISDHETVVTHPFVSDRIFVKIEAKDSQGENVPDGTVLTVRTDRGSFENNAQGALGDSVMVLTSAGVANVFFNCGTEPGEAEIFVRVGIYQQSKVFTIENYAQILSIVGLTATPTTIYADNNITYSTIKAWVRDADGYSAPNVPVRFKTLDASNPGVPLGRIISTVYTDSSGVAKSSFWDDGSIGVAEITATVKSYSTINTSTVIAESSSSVNVTIESVPDVESVTLSSIAQEFKVNQKVVITASAKYVTNADVTDNTLITFYTDLGTFEDSAETTLGNSVSVPTSNGNASIVLNTGLRADTGSLYARIGDVSSSTHNFVVKNGRPAVLEISSYIKEHNSDVIIDTTDTWAVNSPYDIEIQTKVKDAYNNMCPGSAVKFLTDLGTFESQNQELIRNSDVNGVARVLFTPGLSAGVANMTISANQDTLQAQYVFTVTSDDLYSISFTTDQQISINVIGTGGQESAILNVNLRDINGNLLNNPTTLYFWIRNTNPPEGANLNNQNFGWTDEPVQVTSSGGIAQVSVNSGTESGIISVLVSTLEDHNLYNNNADAAAAGAVYAMKPNISINSGPPAIIEPFIGDFNTGEAQGGGMWRIIAGANVKDEWGNPVGYGTSIWFEIIRPDFVDASIVAESYVGNESVDGDSLAGIAYTVITYHGSNTFDSIEIIANTVGANGNNVSGSALLPLPLNQPQMEAQSMPGILEFWPSAPDGTGYTWRAIAGLNKVKLTDGQGNPVNGAFVSGTADRGRYVNVNVACDNGLPWNGPTYGPKTHADFVEINEAANAGADLDETTLWLNQNGEWEEGIAIFWWALNCYEIRPYDPNTATPGQTPVQLQFRLLGTGSTASSQVMVYNYSLDIILPN